MIRKCNPASAIHYATPQLQLLSLNSNIKEF
jgi:hypothetical protein